MYAVSHSIKTAYFLMISTDFHKPRDLFWDRWSYLHNLHQLNGLQDGPRVSWSVFEILFGTPLEVAQIHFRMFFWGRYRETHLCVSRACFSIGGRGPREHEAFPQELFAPDSTGLGSLTETLRAHEIEETSP
jgi:hypothetical protein